MGSYPLLSQAPTHVEVELGCDNKYDVNVADSACVEELDCILSYMSSNLGNEKDDI